VLVCDGNGVSVGVTIGVDVRKGVVVTMKVDVGVEKSGVRVAVFVGVEKSVVLVAAGLLVEVEDGTAGVSVGMFGTQSNCPA